MRTRCLTAPVTVWLIFRFGFGSTGAEPEGGGVLDAIVSTEMDCR